MLKRDDEGWTERSEEGTESALLAGEDEKHLERVEVVRSCWVE